jgi:uncharacterized protein with ATP-grasp and redox domains
LIAEIPETKIRPIADPSAPDQAEWNSYTSLYENLNWLQVPWFFAEHYFYRRIMEAVRYFQSDSESSLDPFSYQKNLGLQASLDESRSLSENLAVWLAEEYPISAALHHLFDAALWGNRADLSLWPVGMNDQPEDVEASQAESYLLIDDMDVAIQRLISSIGDEPIVDILIDNAGFELVTDLCLTDFLLSREITSAVRLHVKEHPTFVSDATQRDVELTLDFFQTSDHTNLAALGDRLQEHLNNGRLVLVSDFFWTSPLSMWEMPAGMSSLFTESGLVISKGDANYRRLLGDRHWSFTSSFAGIMAYLPAPLLALRTLKAELACGLSNEMIERVSLQDPQWMTNGRWGIIQLSEPPSD